VEVVDNLSSTFDEKLTATILQSRLWGIAICSGSMESADVGRYTKQP